MTTQRFALVLLLLAAAAACNKDPAFPYYLYDTSPDEIEGDAGTVEVGVADADGADIDESDVVEDVERSCLDGQDCLEGQACVDRVCLEVCQIAEECSGGTPICETTLGVCVQCATPNDCADGQSCQDYECVNGCEVDEDCEDGTICDEGFCVEPELICVPGVTECDGDSVRICVDGLNYQLEDCADGNACVLVDGSAACVPEAGCTSGQTGCVDEITRWVCGESGEPESKDCESGEVCDAGACVSGADSCITTDVSEIDFGYVQVGSFDSVEVLVSTCGDAPVTVTDVEMTSDGFFLNGREAPYELDPAVEYQVGFTPVSDVAYSGSLTLRTDAGDEVIIQLNGLGGFGPAPLVLHASLTWGPNSDLDQHLLRNEGVATWTSMPGDCHHSNPTPEWGEPGSADNPTLDVDDTNGFGPENINIPSVEYGVEYVGGVFVTNMHGETSQTATYDLYLDGELLTSLTHEFHSANEFWTAFTLTVDADLSYGLGTMDTVSDGYPAEGP